MTVSMPAAAEAVLRSHSKGAPLHYRRITELAIVQGLIDPQGLTPEASMNAGITQDMKRRSSSGREQRFKAYGRGLYGLAMPADPLGGAITENNRRVRGQLRQILNDTDPQQFETLIGSLLVALGFEDVEVTKYSGDGGVDVRAILSVGGITDVRTAVQVKRWSNNVSGRVVRELRGGLGPHERGLVITLSDFTRDARREAEEVDRSPISLIDGEKLIDLMVEHEIGVIRKSAEILQLDEASLAEQVADDPESTDVDHRPRALTRRPVSTTKSLSIWPLPGGGDEWKVTLERMLKYVASEAPSMPEATKWLIDSFDPVNSEKVVRGYWQVLRSFGFIESDGEQLVLTGDGSTYLEDPSAPALLQQMRAQIAGTDELIGLLMDSPTTIPELRAHLNEVLGTQWETDAQVKFRLGWLSVLGVVEATAEVASLAPGFHPADAD